MAQEQFNERLIISLNEEGNFGVHSLANPTKSYTVSGTPEGPKCTCPDLEEHKKTDPEWKCGHMLAVLNLLNKTGEPAASGDREPQPTKEKTVAEAIRGLEMHIKRSVSRDDKINSLSITLSYPVESDSSSEVKNNAERLIGVLSEITDQFKQENGKAPEQRSVQQNSGNGSVPAQILSVGGMKGTWEGRRLFLNFDVNMMFAYLIGWRTRSEILTLRWTNIDFRAGTVRLEPGTTKNKEGLTIYMNPLMKTLLEEELKRTKLLQRKFGRIVSLVFSNQKGNPIVNYSKAWGKACREAGLLGKIPHDFRRMAVRNMVKAGIPERVAMQLTGHKTRSVFDRYHIVSDGDLKEASLKLYSAQLATISATAHPANSTIDDTSS